MRQLGKLDLGAYARAFYLLFRHPQIMLAPLLASLAQVLLFAILPGGDGLVGSLNSGLGGLIAQLITSFGVAVAIIVADSSWRYGRSRFDDASETARRRAGDILFAALGVSFVTYVASLAGSIVPVVGSLALGLVATFFMIYALPAAAIGGVPGGASLQVSIERARGAPLPTLVLTIAYLLATIYGPELILLGLAPLLLEHSFAGSVIATQVLVAVAKAVVQGYVALVIAKTYEDIAYGRRWR